MGVKKISFELSEQSIDKAIQELAKYKKWVEKKTAELIERLAMVGIYEASVRFRGAWYDSDTGNDTQLSVEPIENGYKIIAEGAQVCFVEFGAGVYYNGDEPYPDPPGRPSNIGKIGTYGQGKGSRSSWGYYDSNGNLQITHGTPAAMPMYHAARKIERELLSIAREVFK